MHAAEQWVLDHFRITRDKTIDLVRALPEESLTRQAEGEVMALGKLLRHISDSAEWYMSKVMLDGGAWPPSYASDKAGVINALQTSRDRLLNFFRAEDGARLQQHFVERFPDGHADTFTGQQAIDYLIDHEVHHRGKIVLALRQWGFTAIPMLPFTPGPPAKLTSRG